MIAFCYTHLQLYIVMLHFFDSNINLLDIKLILSERFSANFMNRINRASCFGKVYQLKHPFPPKNGVLSRIKFLLSFKGLYLQRILDAGGVQLLDDLKYEEIITGSPDSFLLTMASKFCSLQNRLILIEDGNLNYIEQKKKPSLQRRLYYLYTGINVEKRYKNSIRLILQYPEKANLTIKKYCELESIQLIKIYRNLTEDKRNILKTIFNLPIKPKISDSLFWTTNFSNVLPGISLDKISDFYSKAIEENFPTNGVLYIKSHPAEPMKFLENVKREVIIIDKETPFELLEHEGFLFDIAAGPFSSVLNQLHIAKKVIQIPIYDSSWKEKLRRYNFPDNAFEKMSWIND